MGHAYIKESDTFSTSQNGTVPKPSASDVSNNKVLKADGTWVAQSGGGGGGSSHNYSYTEQVMGTWIDGKPLYEKTIEISSLALSTQGVLGYYGRVNIPDYISNVSKIWLQPNSYYLLNDAQRGFLFWADEGNGYLDIFVEYNRSNKDCVLVLQYTKTTD